LFLLAVVATPTALWARPSNGSQTRLPAVEAASRSAESRGDNVRVPASSPALVAMMTDPGLALFDGGLVRTRMSFRRVVQSSILREVVTVAWAAGDMAWGGGGNGILSVICVSRGSTNAGGAPRADYAPTIPQ